MLTIDGVPISTAEYTAAYVSSFISNSLFIKIDLKTFGTDFRQLLKNLPKAYLGLEKLFGIQKTLSHFWHLGYVHPIFNFLLHRN